LFGVFASVRLVIVDFCQNNDDILAQKPGAQQFLSCPDLSAAQQSLDGVFEAIDGAIASANVAIQSALSSHGLC
jgi:hypothetical protein